MGAGVIRHPWMPIFWGDFLANTMELTAQEAGAYLFLIAHAWENEGLVPLDRAQRIARVSNFHWKKVWKALEPFFEFQPASDGLPVMVLHLRVLKELHRTEEISRKRKQAALQKQGIGQAIADHQTHAKRLQNGGNHKASIELPSLSEAAHEVPNANRQNDQTPSSLAPALHQGALTRSALTERLARTDAPDVINAIRKKPPHEVTAKDHEILREWKKQQENNATS